MPRGKEKRFEIVHTESTGFACTVSIYRDKKTGVCYLFTQQGYAGGLTPLLDSTGQPIVDSGSSFR